MQGKAKLVKSRIPMVVGDVRQICMLVSLEATKEV